jgi:hypothetical protein
MKPQLANTEYTIFDALLESLKKKEQEKAERQSLLEQLRSPLNLASLFLMVVGSAAAIWISHLVWHDIAFWGKDIALILFGSRIGEAISLGIGLQVIHHVIISVALLLSSLIMLFRNRIIRPKK